MTNTTPPPSEGFVRMVQRDLMTPSIEEAALMTGTATPNGFMGTLVCTGNHGNPLGACMLCNIEELESKPMV